LKRPDEEFCKAQFDAFIKQFFIPSQITWEEVTQQNEPPDYYLFLDNTKFAVEVTNLIELVSVGTSSSLPHSTISMFFQQFVNKVETEAQAEGNLQGNYLVSFPTPIDDFSIVHDGIKTKLLEYIRKTSAFETAPLEIVFERLVSQKRPQQCGIQKLGSKRDRVTAAGPVWIKWEGDAANDICDLVNESLVIKKDKLKNIPGPQILLLLDEYRFANRQMYENCAPHLSPPINFHTVFVVRSNEEGFVLHSQSHNWLS
jgi:hypothetical protein